MKKFISAVVSFGLLSALVGCNLDSDYQKKSQTQREQSEISEDVSKLLSDLVVLESQNLQKSPVIMKNCEKFADSLLYLSKKVMAKGRNPKINSQILDMTNRIVEVGRKVRNSFLRTDFFSASIFWDCLFEENRESQKWDSKSCEKPCTCLLSQR